MSAAADELESSLVSRGNELGRFFQSPTRDPFHSIVSPLNSSLFSKTNSATGSFSLVTPPFSLLWLVLVRWYMHLHPLVPPLEFFWSLLEGRISNTFNFLDETDYNVFPMTYSHFSLLIYLISMWDVSHIEVENQTHRLSKTRVLLKKIVTTND